MKARIKQVVKASIALIVVVGLVLATRSAFIQWNDQQSAALERVRSIEKSLAALEGSTASQDQRSLLEAELEAARSTVPSLFNLNWRSIVLAGVFYLVSLVPGGLVLYEATRALGYRVRPGEAIAAQVVGHLGKYVPGKAMVVVIRSGRLVGKGVPILAGSVSVFLETLLMMAVGAALAGCLVFFLPVDRRIAWISLLGGIAATFPTLPPMLKWIVRKVGMTGGEDSEHATRLESSAGPMRYGVASAVSHDWRFFFLAWFWQLVAWGLIGASFACLVESLPNSSTEYPLATVYAASVAAIALAMVVGFASLLPGGAGVRELTLAVILTPVIGSSQALLAAILARMLFIVVELLAVMMVMIGGQGRVAMDGR